jgi:hypothetical protein
MIKASGNETAAEVEENLAAIRGILNDSHPEVRRAMVGYLNTIQKETPETRLIVRSIATHEDPSVRVQAIDMCNKWIKDPETCIDVARLIISARPGGVPSDWDTANALALRFQKEAISRKVIPAMAEFLRYEADTKPYRGFFSDGAHSRAMELMKAQWDAEIEAIPDLVPGLCRSYVRVPSHNYKGWVRTRDLAWELLNRCGKSSVKAIRETVAEEKQWLATVADVKLKETTERPVVEARPKVEEFIRNLEELANKLDKGGQ